MGSLFSKRHQAFSSKRSSIFCAFLIIVGGFFVFVFSAHAASSVVINEIQTGGADADDEFIELWNGSDTAIVLEDWSLQYKTATGTTINKRNFENGATIPAQGYYLVATKEYTGSSTADLIQSSISLAKSGGNLFLVRNQEMITNKDDADVVDRVAWGTGDSAETSAGTAPEAGQSIARDDGLDTNNNAKDFSVQTTPTPAHTKTATTTGSVPASSQSTALPPSNTSTNATPKKESVKEEKGMLSITEILPNPVGSDEGEFIELYNTGTATMPLTGWRITNRLEQEYILKEGAIAPKEYRVLWREQSGLALQNDRDDIRLFAPDKDRATEVIKFTAAPEGSALMRYENDAVVWTTTPTPGETNHLVKERNAPRVMLHMPKEGVVGDVLNFDASDSFDPQGQSLVFQWNFGDEYGNAEGSRAIYIYLKPGTFSVTLIVTNQEGLRTTETQKIKISGEDLLAEKEETVIADVAYSLSLSNGDRSNHATDIKKILVAGEIATAPGTVSHRTPLASGTIRGVVTVPPGVLAKTYLYIVCETPCAGEGVKVRMTKAEWPALQKGDVVTVTGKTSAAGNEPSFLTKKEQVRVTGNRKRVMPEPLPVFRALDDTLLRHFVIATGEVTEKRAGVLYLDDSTDELSVSGKSSPLIAEGDRVAIAGILTKNEKGYILKASEPATVINAQPKTTKAPTKIVRDKNAERTKYLVTTLAALFAVAARPTWLAIQRRKQKTMTKT